MTHGCYVVSLLPVSVSQQFEPLGLPWQSWEPLPSTKLCGDSPELQRTSTAARSSLMNRYLTNQALCHYAMTTNEFLTFMDPLRFNARPWTVNHHRRLGRLIWIVVNWWLIHGFHGPSILINGSPVWLMKGYYYYHWWAASGSFCWSMLAVVLEREIQHIPASTSPAGFLSG